MPRSLEKLEAANKLIFVKRYEEARDIIDALLQNGEHRDDLLIHLRRIELATKLQDIDVVCQRYIKELKKNPSDPTLRIALTLAEQHAEEIDPASAAASFQEIMRESGNHAGAFYGIAFSMEMLKNHERAIFNYQECLRLDSRWYPAAFGLSQIYYQMGDDKKGDHYFFQFEETAPYNVYGNFETHRRLSNEFFHLEKYTEAEKAMTSLSEWWQENKGHCPPEIQIYESLSIARLAEHQGDEAKANYRRMQAAMVSGRLLSEKKTPESVLYFVAKSFEEFSQFDQAYKFYKKILSSEDGARPEVIQRIGGQFLVMGEYQLAKELFDEAYLHHPDNPDVRFCQLVSNLKLKGVDVEDYLIGKERMKQLMQNPTDKVELLSLLHSLLAKFKEDPDVHAGLADLQMRIGSYEKAGQHFRSMYQLDPRSRVSGLRYASFEMQYGDQENALKVLEELLSARRIDGEDLIEAHWLKTNYYYRHGQYQKALQFLRQAISAEPWNVSYLVQQVLLLNHIVKIDPEIVQNDRTLDRLAQGEETELDWKEFEERTRVIENAYVYELAYVRAKIAFLYAANRDDYLKRLLSVAVKADAAQCTYDFLRLLNTNYDSPTIYWALGMLGKELWQLETSVMWFEQILLHPEVTNTQKARAYLELADCYVWQNTNLNKAVELVKLAFDLGERGSPRGKIVLAHAHLRLGMVRQAQALLEDSDNQRDPEALYLKGLVHYRNGAEKVANEIWKPLLTMRSESLRFHNIKQEVLKFYFDKEPYLRAN